MALEAGFACEGATGGSADVWVLFDLSFGFLPFLFVLVFSVVLVSLALLGGGGAGLTGLMDAFSLMALSFSSPVSGNEKKNQ